MTSEGDSTSVAEGELRALEPRGVEQLCEQARRTLLEALGVDRARGLEGDLAMIDALAPAKGGVALLEPEAQAAAAVLLGKTLVDKLKLEWVESKETEERGVRYPHSDFVFYPRLMVQSQVAQARHQGRLAELELSWLVASTRDYLKNLVRFHPTQK